MDHLRQNRTMDSLQEDDILRMVDREDLRWDLVTCGDNKDILHHILGVTDLQHHQDRSINVVALR